MDFRPLANLVLMVLVKASEFEIFEEFEPEQSVQQPQKVILPPRYNLKEFNILDFKFEIFMLSFITIYVARYFFGSKQNKKVARKWLEANVQVFEENFHQVGSDDGFKLVTDGPRDFVFYATGRIHCEKLYAQIRTAARHDILLAGIDSYYGLKMVDKVTFKVFLNAEECDSICFGIIADKLKNSIMKERWDLHNFTKAVKLNGFPKSAYVATSDCPEWIAKLWKLDSLKFALWKSIGLDIHGNGIKNTEPIIEQITLSDLPHYKPETEEGLIVPKELVFVFRIPDTIIDLPSEVVEYQKELSNLVLDVIDFIGENGRLSAEQRKRAKDLREAALLSVMKDKEEDRKRELADKKIAEKKAKMDRLMQLSPESQRKIEEKMKKKDLKKRLRSKTVKM